MHTRKRLLWFLALTTVVALTAACGGAAEEPAPAEEPPAAEEPEPVPVEPEPVPEPDPVDEVPELVGNIVEVGEAEQDWTTTPTRDTPGEYYWIARYRNDTTQTLDITVTFQFLNDSDEIVKEDKVTVRVAPAETGEFRGEGEMVRDDVWSVVGYTYFPDWKIVESN